MFKNPHIGPVKMKIPIPHFTWIYFSNILTARPLKIPMENESMIHFLWIAWFPFFLWVDKVVHIFFCRVGGGGQVSSFWQKLEAKFFTSYSSTSPPLWDLLRGFLVLACLCLDSPPSRGVICLAGDPIRKRKKSFSGTWTRIEDVFPIEHGGVFQPAMSVYQRVGFRILVDIMSDLWCMVFLLLETLPLNWRLLSSCWGPWVFGPQWGLGRPMNVPTF